MISLSCTNCKANLTIDDAFAGGVCRCQHCGTIQTVPSHLKGNGAEAGGVATAQARALYSTRATAKGAAGLEGLADAVASSGLAGSGLSSRGVARGAGAAPAGSQKKLLVLLIAAGVVILLLLGLVIYLATGTRKSTGNAAQAGNSSTPTPTPTHTASPTPPSNTHAPDHNTAVNNQPPIVPAPPPENTAVLPANHPQYLGVDLSGDASVVYVLDHGNGTGAHFDDLKVVTVHSVASLGPQKKFAVVFWNNTDNKKPDLIFPASGLLAANAASQTQFQAFLDEVYATGQSNIASALKKAVALHPAAIVIVTGKDPDAGFANQVKQSITGKVKVHLLSLGLDAPSPEMKKAADLTGGTYRDVSDADLKQLNAGE